jgi:hypothetical protein
MAATAVYNIPGSGARANRQQTHIEPLCARRQGHKAGGGSKRDSPIKQPTLDFPQVLGGSWAIHRTTRLDQLHQLQPDGIWGTIELTHGPKPALSLPAARARGPVCTAHWRHGQARHGRRAPSSAHFNLRQGARNAANAPPRQSRRFGPSGDSQSLWQPVRL